MKYQIKYMLRNRFGRIVNVSSMAGLKGVRGGASYSASKHGVIGLTKSAAIEYGDHNIRVNSVCPGFIDTKLIQNVPKNVIDFNMKINPMKRIGKTKEVADSILWLLSEKSSFVNGHSISIDGGYGSYNNLNMKKPKFIDELNIPAIAAPMFLISGPKLVTECCKNGIVGTFPALNQRTSEGFEEWIIEIKKDLEKFENETGKKPAPYGVNLIVHPTNPRVRKDLSICIKHKVPIIITSLGAVSQLVSAVHSYGGLVFHDVIKKDTQRKLLKLALMVLF